MIAHIFENRCVACNDCVRACPTHVLDPAPSGPPVIARPDQCQTCFLCELYCEVDAIYVGPEQAVAGPVDTAQILASGDLGRLRRDHGWAAEDRDPDALAEFWRLGPLLREGADIAAARYARRHAADSARIHDRD